MRKTKSKLSFKIGALNCHGAEDKVDLPEMIELVQSCDIFGVNEPWLSKGQKIEVPDYEYFPLNRTTKKGPVRGGLGIFIKDSLKDNIKVRYDLSCENFLFCTLKKNYFGYHEDVFVGIIYIPPEDSTREKKLNIDHFTHLQEVTSTIDSDNIILLGDFNSRTGTMDDVLLAEKHQDQPHFDFYSNMESYRSNQDDFVNAYGKKISRLLLCNTLIYSQR